MGDPRRIETHHDGHGLAERIEIEADEPGPGGASHKYRVYVDISGTQRAYDSGCTGQARENVAEIQYQRGPRAEDGSTPGVLDSVLLAIVADRMESFQAGPFASTYNSNALVHVRQAMRELKFRADERAARGVLGKNVK